MKRLEYMEAELRYISNPGKVVDATGIVKSISARIGPAVHRHSTQLNVSVLINNMAGFYAELAVFSGHAEGMGKKSQTDKPNKANPEKPLVFRPWERKSLFLNIYPPLLKGFNFKILID